MFKRIDKRQLSLLLITILFPLYVNAQDIYVKINLRGVYESKISLLPLSGSNTIKPILEFGNVMKGTSTTFKIPKEYLPGEFVLRFDYKENILSTPYPSEKRIVAYNQDLELWVNPIFSNNQDSTWFQKDERENRTYEAFLKENAKQKAQLGLLQNFLLNYDDPKSSFYKEGIKEYEKRRQESNLWINERVKLNNNLFVSRMFGFQHVPPINWKGSESERKQSLRENYFEGMDFSDSLILKTTNMKEWMDGYVNLYGELATSVSKRDSLFTLAGKSAIEKVKNGNPLVYGWMVDYFFKGYESFNIESGTKILEQYLNDPNCFTSKRQEINKRLKGIETLVPGTIAPNIIILDSENKPFELNSFSTEKEHILLLFWSADCSHCQETVGKLYPLFLNAEIQKKMDVVAVSVDETDTEVNVWQKKITELKGWTHLRPAEGLRSKIANDYYILGVPVMILLDTKTKKIVALPENTQILEKFLGL